MNEYHPPILDMQFTLYQLADMDNIAQLPGYQDTSQDLVTSILEEAGKMATHILAPLNRNGDQQGSTWQNGNVKTPDGWKKAYQQFVESGWNSLPFNPAYNGQGLPWTLATPLMEMWHSANMAFALCPMLTQAAVEALERHGTEELKNHYLAKLISGEWTGTMNLTEAQAGSDLSAVRTKAIPHNDHYLITGQKIFITYGDHDLTDNIIHFVLARTPDAPEGIKGISMFLVPKFLTDAQGNILQANDVRCVSLEHKLGIHGSPTAVMAYGDQGGAIGYLIGNQNEGLAHMFTMMKLARHAVGVEGLAISERAYQQARHYARERIQGIPVTTKKRAPIIEHPDIKRMLMTMKSQIEAMRALTYYWAASYDTALHHTDNNIRQKKLAEVELLTPVVKAWCTETCIEITSHNLQIHGGMGYIEETGAAQHYRDARITTIYEGTTGIQANDLIHRKILRDEARAMRALITHIQTTHTELATHTTHAIRTIHQNLGAAIQALQQTTDWLLTSKQQNLKLPAYAACHYTRLTGLTCGGWLMARAALSAHRQLAQQQNPDEFHTIKIMTAQFYAQQILPQTIALQTIITQGSDEETALKMRAECF